jgi:ribosomal protein S18 acetylase RimI-like enzyme
VSENKSATFDGKRMTLDLRGSPVVTWPCFRDLDIDARRRKQILRGARRESSGRKTNLRHDFRNFWRVRFSPEIFAMSEIEIKALSASPKICETLSEILIEVVTNGGSVSFMHPLEPQTARAFWDDALAAAARDERIVLGAWDGEVLAGTVTLLLDCPPNQPHRAEIAKLMTRPSYWGRGVAAALMREAESKAVERARTLLVLDTAVEGGASGLYEKLGYVLAGTIPDYALKPHGGLTGTRIYWKRIGGSSEKADSNARNLP